MNMIYVPCIQLLLLVFGLSQGSCLNKKATDNPTQKVSEEMQPPLSFEVEKSFLLGKFDPATHPDFVLIPEKHASRAGMYIHKETWSAYMAMYNQAQKEGISLKILSATRNFDAQKGIWERKFMDRVTKMSRIPEASDRREFALDILKFSSMPGTSRHHWGSDIDINSLSGTYFDSGQGKIEYEWLVKNGPTYGFCQPYTNKQNGRTGYEEEKWHWSYLPLAVPLYQAYQDLIQYDDICCFEGSEFASDIQVILNYVQGIASDCVGN
jgi:D-alanyl-D-alanine carboxypeptidase